EHERRERAQLRLVGAQRVELAVLLGGLERENGKREPAAARRDRQRHTRHEAPRTWPALAAVHDPVADAAEHAVTGGYRDREQTRGAVIGMSVAQARREDQRRAHALEHRGEVALETLAGVGM